MRREGPVHMALPRALQVLSAERIVAIDEALHSLGAFGEVG